MDISCHGSPTAAGVIGKAAAQRLWQEHSIEINQRLPWPADQMTVLADYLQRARQPH
jgi:hypothetical protein